MTIYNQVISSITKDKQERMKCTFRTAKNKEFTVNHHKPMVYQPFSHLGFNQTMPYLPKRISQEAYMPFMNVITDPIAREAIQHELMIECGYCLNEFPLDNVSTDENGDNVCPFCLK